MINHSRLCLFLFLLAGFCSSYVSAQTDPRSDSTDVLSYTIHLDVTDFSNKKISARTGVRIQSKTAAISRIRLDLLKLPVSEVSARGVNLAYQYNDTLLNITLAQALNSGDTVTVWVSYEGTPQKESFGGFYFSGLYAFNLGVGFKADPHTYGRAWFPCYDNFTDRAVYDFYIVTDTTRNALCNGLFQSKVKSGNAITWHWKMNEPIPTYLASVAVAPYHWIESSYNGMGGNVPVILACLPSDTLNMKQSFAKLPVCLATYESLYGPHTFSRIGFNAVPFNGGAMEHATNIAYPLFAVDGTTSNERLWAHEFAHHWWGNTITCLTAEDMWINEGWAAYSEKIFFEGAYGKAKYKEEVSDNHRYVLQFAHINDLEPRAISGVPHDFTYGTHVYKKGADVAHTLRGYMGDAAFFQAISQLMSQKKFSNISSAQFRDFLQTYTTADMTAFFDNWVFEKGFPHVGITSRETTGSAGSYTTKIRLRQVSRFTNTPYRKLPLEVALYKPDLSSQKFNILVCATDSVWQFSTSFNPVMVALDPDEKISDAITDKNIVVKDTGNYDFGDALMTMHIGQLSDSALVRVEHHWIGADAGLNFIPGLFLSNYRHWTVDGSWGQGFNATATVAYNGVKNTEGYLDHTLIRVTEDSLVLAYRPDALSPWQLYDDYTKNMQSKTDKKGSITIRNLKKGQYALAMYDKQLTGIKKNEDPEYTFRLDPNPGAHEVKVIFSRPVEGGELCVYDATGRAVRRMVFLSGSKTKETFLETFFLPDGVYLVVFFSGGKVSSTQKLVINR